MSLRTHRQIGAARKGLPEQAIGVLIRAALPRTLRIAKIYVDFGRQRKSSMIRKFLSPVPSQRPIQLLDRRAGGGSMKPGYGALTPIAAGFFELSG
jgi:hypothetical protein